MTSYRRRGTHAARPAAAPFVAAKRPPRSRPGGSTAAKSGAAGGIRRSGLRFRMTRRKWIAAGLAAGFVAVSFAGGLWSTPSAEPTVQSFLLAWQEGRYLTAAELTTGRPVAVAAALKNAYLQLDAASYALAMGPITQQGGTASAAFGAWVDLGQNGAPWYYHGRFDLRRTGSQWKIVWSPSVINPELHNGLRLAVVSSTPRRALVEDAAGAPLQQPSTAYVAGVRLDRLTHPAVTAARLARVTKLDPSQLLGWILAAPKDSFQELVVLRPGQYQRMAGRLARVPGLIIRTEQLRLFDSVAPAVVGTVGTELSSVLRNQGIAYRPGATVGLSGLQRARQRDLAGTPTIKVVTETAGGRQVSVLASWPGQSSRPVRTTIDSGLQTAVDAALGPLPQSAAVVAVQASTGHILTVAEHTAPGVPGIDPLAGSYPPGPAFTIVSTEALLASGLRVGTQVPCTKVNDVGGRIFTNVPPVQGSGSQPVFVTDFANACGTAFSGLSWRLSGHDLTAAASGFGLGAPWQLPLPSFSGSIQPPSSVAAIAAGTIGEAGVQVSPLTMALIAGQVDSGTRHAPSLLAGADPPTPKAAGDPPFSAASLATLRTLMRATVQQGVAGQANLAGQPVYGQVGTVSVRRVPRRRRHRRARAQPLGQHVRGAAGSPGPVHQPRVSRSITAMV
jgi:Penicillin binding protein transpeptidase domain/NTF2-like N-terminal transpeptidase domain/Penicillin-binding Protein dimerisation domain